MSATLTREEIAQLVMVLPPSQRGHALRYTGAIFGTGHMKPAARAETGRELFVDYITRVAPWFVWYKHGYRWAALLQRVADGDITRLLMGAPPRHIKSTLLQLFSAYYLQEYPARWVGTTAYAAKIAYKNAGAARLFYEQGGGALDKSAVQEWHTGKGGGHWAAGMGGSLIAFGYHLGIIDDPVSGPSEAFSESVTEGNWDFFKGTFWNRMEPGGAVIVTHQRWPGKGDLIGRILDLESESDMPERWHVILDEAIKTDHAPEIPASCTLHPDDRAPGEALCPERYSIDQLTQIRATVGDFWFDAQYQQHPSARAGNMFQWGWFEIVDQTPIKAERIRYWDTAATESGGDFTVGVLLARDANGVYYAEDTVRGQWGSGRRNAIVRETALKERAAGLNVTHWFEKQTGQAGADQVADFRRSLEGFSVQDENASGSKFVRAEPVASAAKAGNVKIRRASWNAAFLNELCDFAPGCAHDDVPDSLSGAYNKLAAGAGRAWYTPHFTI